MSICATKYIIINHGFMGSNTENWFPYVKEKIDDESHQVIIPQYPVDKEHQFYDYWKKVLDQYNGFGYINSNTVMIGHSSGAIFTIKYLLNIKIKIDKLILVSGFNNYFAENEDQYHSMVNKSMYVEEDMLKKVKNYCNEIIVIYGSDDPYIPQETFHNFATHLGAEEVIITNGGHLNTAAGFNEFSKVLTYL